MRLTDIQGWDEFSAYNWLNSPQGKKAHGIPLTKHVGMDEVRGYIAASDPGQRFTGKLTMDSETAKQFPTIQQPEQTAIQAALAELINEPWVRESFKEYEEAAEATGGDITTEQVIRMGVNMYAAGIKTMIEDGQFEDEDMLDYTKNMASYAITLYAYWKDQLT